ncbi:DUF5707 domain-containing protein [Streptomyces polygonati]|uniref:DUF5707 domain-containing protein n=1 Tax=Streptomyces polygonati TaxID=1617087 RepID=A0ABV8HKA2_9ACTN
MRITAPVLVGALALGALAAPAAFAAGAAPTIDKVSVPSLVFSPQGTDTFTFSSTVSSASGIKSVQLLPWPKFLETELGYTPAAADVKDPSNPKVTCKASSATTSVCTDSEPLNAHTDLADNAAAGGWYAAVLVTAKDGTTTFNAKATSFSFRRQSVVTVDAAPEPVKKNATLTVTGHLSLADWSTGAWRRYGAQTVQLQFRASTATAYTTLKSVKTSSTGELKTTVKATASGFFRYVYAGNSLVAPSTAAVDGVAVK